MQKKISAVNAGIRITGICLSLAIIIGFTAVTVPGAAQENPANNPQDNFADGVDVTERFRKLNETEQAKIPSQFRTGNVSSASSSPEIHKTDSGFEISLGNTNIPSPVIDKGRVFVSGGFGSRQYFAFDAATGKKIWSIDLDDDGPSSAVIVDDIIVFNTESCTVFACRAGSGEQIWSYWLGDPLMSMPAIANGIVFTAYPAHGLAEGATHVLIAIELRTGRILWQRLIDGDVLSAPVAAGDELFVTTFAGTLFKFKQKTGEIVSAKSIRATSAAVVYQDQIFISRRTERAGEAVSESVAGVDRQGFEQTKEFNKKAAPYLDKDVQAKSKLKESAMANDAGNGFTGGAPISSGWMEASQVVGQSNVSSLQSYQGSRTLSYRGSNYNTMGDELICTDIITGKETWKLKIRGDLHAEGGFLGTPPLAAGDRIVVASFNGEITVHHPKTGNVERKYTVQDNIRYQPVVQDGWLYVTTTSGKLIAVNTGDATLTGWPMWGADPGRTNIVK